MPPSYNTRSSTDAAAAATAPTGTVVVSPTDTAVAKPPPPPPPPPKVQPETPVEDETAPVPPPPSDTAEAKDTILPIVADAYEVPQPEFATDMGAATVNPEVTCYFAPHVLVDPSTAPTASTSPPSPPDHDHNPIVTSMKVTERRQMRC
jgi:hypothetical protein